MQIPSTPPMTPAEESDLIERAKAGDDQGAAQAAGAFGGGGGRWVR